MQIPFLKILFAISLLGIITFLSGCYNVLSTGAQVAYNHQSLQKNLNDQLITMHAFQALNYKTDQFKDANISISTFNSEVLLAGQVPKVWQKKKAEQIVKEIPDIKEIHNLLAVESPSSSLTHISDAWITAKVKVQLIASNDLDATTIKVVTENGTVYLMGTLQPSEADAAVDIASHTDGVSSVVKIFSYISISKKRQDKMVS